MGLLHIYDSSDKEIAEKAKKRVSEKSLPISNIDELQTALNDLLHERKVFDRILFETHGYPGIIRFNGKSIDTNYWKAKKGRYEFLTAQITRIYFNGCNVGEDEVGWQFLEAVAEAFMVTTSGEVFAHDTKGRSLPFIDHVFHIFGRTRYVTVSDGKLTGRAEY
ncbi:MAG: hypothetical protein AAB336_00875 [Acidobacteriota bacterium]